MLEGGIHPVVFTLLLHRGVDEYIGGVVNPVMPAEYGYYIVILKISFLENGGFGTCVIIEQHGSGDEADGTLAIIGFRNCNVGTPFHEEECAGRRCYAYDALDKQNLVDDVVEGVHVGPVRNGSGEHNNVGVNGEVVGVVLAGIPRGDERCGVLVRFSTAFICFHVC